MLKLAYFVDTWQNSLSQNVTKSDWPFSPRKFGKV